MLVFDPNRYVPKADYVHPAVLSEGVQELFVNGVAAVDDGKMTGALSGRPLPHTPPAGHLQIAVIWGTRCAYSL